MQNDSGNKITVLETDNKVPSIPIERSTHSERAKRLRDVRLLYFIRGWGKDQIAEALKASEHEIEKDITYLRKQGKTLGQFDVEYRNDCINFIWELNDKYLERVKRLWDLFDHADSTKEKTDIIGEIRKQEQQHFENLQSLGIVPKEAQKYIHGVVYVSKLKGDKPAEEKQNEKKDIGKNVISVSDAIVVTDASR